MTEPVVRRAIDVSYDDVGAADGMHKGVLIGEDEGAPNFAMRRFVLDPGATVPEHTNEVEHEQYVLEGEYIVGIKETSETSHGDGDAVEAEEYEVSAGDSLLIPAGVVHWYRNEGDEEGSFICVVPHGKDEIELVE